MHQHSRYLSTSLSKPLSRSRRLPAVAGPATPLFTTLATLAITSAVVLTAASAASGAAPAQLTMYGGYSFGTWAHVGSYTGSGRSAVTALCTSKAGVQHSNHTGATSIPKVGTVGAVSTRLHTSRPASGPVSSARTTTAGLNLLSKIRASSIITTANVARTAAGIVRTGQTSFVGLKIAGHSAPPAHPAIDQKVVIPGVATLLFNHHVATQALGNYRLTVIALTVTIPKGNSAHLPAGTILVGRSGASLHRQTYADPRGYAFGTSVHAASLAGSGRTAAVYLPCGGTNGATTHNRVSAAHAPNVVRSGPVTSTGHSSDSATSTLARTGNTIAHPALFGGVIKAKAVKVIATVTRARSGALHRSNTVSITGLTVNGQSRNGSAPANTKLTIPHLGTLWIHRVVNTPTGMTVHGLDLVLSVTKNGLKKGTELIVGSAFAAVSST